MHISAKRFPSADKLWYVCGQTFHTLSPALLFKEAAPCAGSHPAELEQIASSFLLAMWLGRPAHVVGGKADTVSSGRASKGACQLNLLLLWQSCFMLALLQRSFPDLQWGVGFFFFRFFPPIS